MAGSETTTDEAEALLVRGQIHDLRLDLQRMHPNGLVGNVLCWWIWPVKFLADPAFAAAETVVPLVTSRVPFSDRIVGMGLNVTETVMHACYGLVHRVGLVSSSSDDEDEFKTLSYYLSLMELAPSEKKRLLRMAAENAGHLQFLLGTNDSSAASLLTHPSEVLTMLWEGYGALYNYAVKELILEEAKEMGGIRYAENKALLAIIQQADLDSMGKHRVDEMLMDNQSYALRMVLQKFPLEEARHYVKFAVAAYGDNGIKSSKLDSYQTFDWRDGDWTTARVSEHTGIPEEDLVIMDVAYHNDPKQLRHFVALDRDHKKVILAIRGTYTQKEVMIDFNGYSKEFYGGEAHAAMAIMSELLWEKAGDQVIKLLDDNPGFELIITGHSLGGGSTCLVNLILHRDERMQGRKFRAFAFASPPVYCPLSNVLTEAQTCVNFNNQYDGVGFLSGDTVRHQIAMIVAVEKSGLSLLQRARLLLGFDQPDPNLVQQIHDIQREPLPVTKKGCPRGMSIPVLGNVWIWPDESSKEEGTFKAVLADSLKMSETGIFIHKTDFTDHLPARYEYVLNHMS